MDMSRALAEALVGITQAASRYLLDPSNPAIRDRLVSAIQSAEKVLQDSPASDLTKSWSGAAPEPKLNGLVSTEGEDESRLFEEINIEVREVRKMRAARRRP
jgi:hypothetical protein